MRLYVPVRVGPVNESLRYALRSWHTFHPDVEPVLFGGRPEWYRGDHVPVRQRKGAVYQWCRDGNFDRQLRAMVARGDEEFVYTHDDIFLLAPFLTSVTFARPIDIDAYLAQWTKLPRASTYVRMFVEGMDSQAKVLRAMGIDTQHNADGHFPHTMTREHLGDLLTLLDQDFPDHPVGHWRMIYGGLYPGKVVRLTDPKVAGHDSPREGLPFVSTETRSWRSQAGKFVRSTFDTPAPWEKP